jgi:hypothetical protein
MVEIARRVDELRRQIERERFAGGDPVVEVDARLDPAEVVARTLAAERAQALLAIGAERLNPSEDRAEAALRGAIGALRSWGFAAARMRLDEAAGQSHDPATQQRITLFKQLARHLSAIVYTPLSDKLRLALADLDEASRHLDLLADAERLHYRDEIDRITALRDAAAKGDPYLNAAWTLLRAQMALGAGQDEGALVWLLHVAASHPAPESDSYLADLVGRARAHLAGMIGLSETDAAEKAEAVRPRDLFNALAARLTADLGRDVVQGMNQFALSDWIAPDVAEEGAAKSRARRGGTAR